MSRTKVLLVIKAITDVKCSFYSNYRYGSKQKLEAIINNGINIINIHIHGTL